MMHKNKKHQSKGQKVPRFPRKTTNTTKRTWRNDNICITSFFTTTMFSLLLDLNSLKTVEQLRIDSSWKKTLKCNTVIWLRNWYQRPQWRSWRKLWIQGWFPWENAMTFSCWTQEHDHEIHSIEWQKILCLVLAAKIVKIVKQQPFPLFHYLLIGLLSLKLLFFLLDFLLFLLLLHHFLVKKHHSWLRLKEDCPIEVKMKSALKMSSFPLMFVSFSLVFQQLVFRVKSRADVFAQKSF